MKIGLRILLGYFLIVALAALLLGRVFVQEVKPGVRQAMEDTLVDTSTLLAELARDDLIAGTIENGRFAERVRALNGRDVGAEIWGFRKRGVSTRIYVTDAEGIVVFDSSGRDVGKDYSRWNDVYLTLRGRYGARSTRADPNDDSSTVMHVAAPIIVHDDGRPRIAGVLTVAKPNQAIAPFILRSQSKIMRWGLVLLGSALVIGLLAAWWLSRQLGALRLYAHAVTAGERATLPDSAGEFGELGRALETMRSKLEGKQYVEQYVHALTHELKSPLAAIRGSAELLEFTADAPPMPEADRTRFVATIRAQSERMAEMIDKLLALAAVEHRQRIEQPHSLDPLMLAQEAAERIAPKFEQNRLRLHVSCEPDGASPGQVSGDAFLLRQSLLNLLDNAADFAPAGSVVELRLYRDGAQILIDVLDRGPGVPDYALERAFERFYSLPRPQGGSRSSGLGLCFVAEVAELHGGRAALANRDEGGTVASLILPAE
ncbi:MAG: two-component system sensor histidine kinase CreC [Lysobacteraceae bacterium]|nr:MAG: two-component system sensor histidine kinase CreC [Xanthomonadaceae bacterium]